MTDEIYQPDAAVVARAHVNADQYRQMYRASIEDPETFWAEQAKRLDWIKPFTKVKDCSFQPGNVHIRWFEDGVLNVAANCLDRHLATRGDQTAIIWEPDDPGAEPAHITYRQLHEKVCRFANVLKAQGVGKGDRVVIYLPMIPAAAVAMLACARIGAIHSVVFAGFSSDSLAKRVQDCDAKLLITADAGLRGGRHVPLKAAADTALAHCKPGIGCLVVRHTGDEIAWVEGRDVDAREAMKAASPDCPPEPMGAEDPLYILYTSGSTGTPKGVVHSTGGYLLYVAMTHEYVFDYHAGDIYWCTADVGWVTGHSYIVYGPLANGATTLMFEGVPTWPDPARFWQVCERHKVNQFYTAPTAIRALMAQGVEWTQKHDLSSLRLLGSVGEPINPEAWRWYSQNIGKGKLPVVDTWWQTENGGILISALPGAIATKPGSATLPFFGVQPAIVDPQTGKELTGTVAEGVLCMKDAWPSLMRTVWGDHERFEKTYFADFKGYYYSSDGARRDADGYYWITGRVDDVINVSGHRMGTAEIESALVAHPKVAEAAVVGYPHDIKGQGIYAYVTLIEGETTTDVLRKELADWVRSEIGPIARPDLIQWARGLPKTRSAKIMRRILRKIAADDFSNLGDTSTLADPSVVDDLIEHRLNRG